MTSVARPSSYSGEAYNQVPDSDNRIHSDEVARQLGFEGALVPGVTVSAYLARPAVEAWGLDWLSRGHAHVTVNKPLYDRRTFRVEVAPDGERAYDATLIDSAGTRCAEGRFELPHPVPEPPTRRGDPPAEGQRVPATPEGLRALVERGMGATRVVWSAALPMATVHRSADEMPTLLRGDRDGYANSSFVLGLTNWIVAANVDLGPWLHLETWSQHHAAIAPDTELIVEARVKELFSRKGHEFVDVDVCAFRLDDSAVLSATLRAIYRLRDG